MGSITHRALAAFTLAALTSVSGCVVESDDGDAETGTIGINLVGQGSSGATFRLRDATITVAGAASLQVWNTEDDPDLTALSANVEVGAYTATLAAGWRLERLVPGADPVTVTATLESVNPVGFEVAAGQRTAVPLRFDVEGGVVDMTQGYDIIIDVNDPTPSIVTTPTSLILPEGSAFVIGAFLSSQPAGPVTVQVTSSDGSAVSVAPATLTFTAANYGVPQQVTLIGNQDADLGDEAVTLWLTGVGLSSAAVSVAVVDDDQQALLTTAPELTVAEGGTGTFGVWLAAQPAADVTVLVTSSSGAVATAAPGSLTFTPANYDVPQLVSVLGAPDTDSPPSNGSALVTLTVPAGPSTAVAVTVYDDDVVAVTPPSMTLCRGDGDAVTVKLLAAPPEVRTLNVTSTDWARVSVSATSLTFTSANWWVEQTLFVDALNSGTAQIVISGPGVASNSAVVTVLPMTHPSCLL